MLQAQTSVKQPLLPLPGLSNHATTSGTIGTSAAGLNGLDYIYGDTSTTVVWPEVGSPQGRPATQSLACLHAELTAVRNAVNVTRLGPRCRPSFAEQVRTQPFPSAGKQLVHCHTHHQCLCLLCLHCALLVFLCDLQTDAGQLCAIRYNGLTRQRILDNTIRDYLSGFDSGCTKAVRRPLSRTLSPTDYVDLSYCYQSYQTVGWGYTETSWFLNTVRACTAAAHQILA
jgi:hypothetical protein